MSRDTQHLALQRKYLRQENRNFGKNLEEICRESWPASYRDPASPDNIGRIQVWRSCNFLVQVFQHGSAERPVIRLSICRAELKSDGRWRDGITWDELQEIKNQVGYADRDAVEVYPKAKDVVNVANIRHLWLLADDLDFAWRL